MALSKKIFRGKIMAEEVWDLDSDEPEEVEKQSWWERKTGEKLKLSEKIGGALFLLVFLFVFYITLDANKYAAQVKVVEGEGRVGVNPTSELLDFGDLSRGTQAVRTVTVSNESFMPFFVSAWRFGGISGLMDLDMNNFLLRKGTEEELNFNVYMPASAQTDRVYTGRVLVFKIPAPFF
jgi:hypothetical protein